MIRVYSSLIPGMLSSQCASVSFRAMIVPLSSSERTDDSMLLRTIRAVNFRSLFRLTWLIRADVPKVRMIDSVVPANATSRSFTQGFAFFSFVMSDSVFQTAKLPKKTR